MRIRLSLLLAIVTAVPMMASSAQVMPTAVVRRGAPGFTLSDGEPISYLLEHAQFLKLTDEQRDLLIDIRRRLRQQTAPFMRQLDSLREYMGLSLESTRGFDREDMERLERFRRESQPITDSLRVYNDAARGEARLALDSLQLVALDSLVRTEGRGTTGRRPPNR